MNPLIIFYSCCIKHIQKWEIHYILKDFLELVAYYSEIYHEICSILNVISQISFQILGTTKRSRIQIFSFYFVNGNLKDNMSVNYIIDVYGVFFFHLNYLVSLFCWTFSLGHLRCSHLNWLPLCLVLPVFGWYRVGVL